MVKCVSLISSVKWAPWIYFCGINMQMKCLIYLVSDSIIISHILIPFSLSHRQFAKFSQYS